MSKDLYQEDVIKMTGEIMDVIDKPRVVGNIKV